MNKAKIGGILEIISGISGFIYLFAFLVMGYLGGFFTSGEDAYLPSEYLPIIIVCIVLFLIFCILALIGGLFALKKQLWTLSLIGAIFSMFVFGVVGLIGLIVIIQAKPEFNEKPI